MDLLDRSKYAAAYDEFHKYLNAGQNQVNKADAQYFAAYCAVKLRREHGEGLTWEFIDSNPDHAMAPMAFFELAQLKYQMRQYESAIEYYERVDFSKIPAESAFEGRFRLGYALFTQKEFERALAQFEQVKLTSNTYQYPARYYSGYINYQKGEYERALLDFKKAEENEAYAPVVPPLVVKVLYKQGRFAELISYGTASLAKPAVRPKSDLHLYLGEAHYRQKEWLKAAEQYSAYLASQDSRPTNELLFRIADVEQRTGNIAGAVEHFKQVAVQNDTLGQLASYYLGNLYVREGNMNYAQASFASARNMNFQPSVKRDAAFQFAKVSYDLGNYDECIRAITQYRELYPDSERMAEADQLLSQAYLFTRNYDVAIAHIESLKSRSPVIESAYQKIAFLKAAELFNDGKFPQSVEMLDRSLAYPRDLDYVVKANYWKAEAFSIGSRYEEALNAYSAVFRADPDGKTAEYALARYGIAHCYFNLRDYEKSIPHYRYFTERQGGRSSDPRFLEARVRLADALFATKRYPESLTVLDQIIVSDDRALDYAYFRKGMIYGIQGNLQESNRNFDLVLSRFTDSNFYVNALFQKSQFNFESGNYREAIDLFSRLIREHPRSNFVPYALQSRAIAYSNLNQAESSVRDYQTIIRQYSTHETAQSALLGLQESLASLGRSGEFSGYLEEYRRANPQSTQLESIEYESAKNLYFNQNYSDLVRAVQVFIERYPSSVHVPELRFYMADALYMDGRVDAALRQYYALAELPGFGRYNRVLQRIAEIELEKGNSAKAVGSARVLDPLTTNRMEQHAVWRVLMYSYYGMSRYDSSAYFARRILEVALVTADAENEALLMLGKSAYGQRNYATAIDYFIATVNAAKDEYGAEAQYLFARIYYERKSYRQSIEALFDLNRQFGHYDQWLGRSFLLISDNYRDLGEIFQAKATLESVIQNSPDPAVVAEAKIKLTELDAAVERGVPAVPDTLIIDTE